MWEDILVSSTPVIISLFIHICCCCCCSVAQSDSLLPHGLQHTRPLCPSPSPEICPSSCPLHWWCHAAILSSDTLFFFCPQSFQHQGLFQWVSCSHQMTKILEFQLKRQSFQWYSRLISLKIHWFDLLAVQGTLRNLLQHHSSKASILQCSAFFMVHLSHPYLTTGLD